MNYLSFVVVILQLDDWVLCRIYKKTNVVHPTASIPSDQEEEEQFVRETLLPCLKEDQIQGSLKPQKSSSFSNLLDAMDYSILGSFLADCPSNPIGVDQYFNTGNLDQPLFSNSFNSSNSNTYLDQSQPQLLSSAPTSTRNRLKRPFPNSDDHEDPQKKYFNSYGFINRTNIQSDHIPQNNLMNPLLYNQQIFLSSELQFQGWKRKRQKAYLGGQQEQRDKIETKVLHV